MRHGKRFQKTQTKPTFCFQSHPGRVVAPVEEAPTKVVKVATTVARRPTAKPEEAKVTTPGAKGEDLHLAVLEESFRSTQPGYEGRSVDAFRFGRCQQNDKRSTLQELLKD